MESKNKIKWTKPFMYAIDEKDTNGGSPLLEFENTGGEAYS